MVYLHVHVCAYKTIKITAKPTSSSTCLISKSRNSYSCEQIRRIDIYYFVYGAEFCFCGVSFYLVIKVIRFRRANEQAASCLSLLSLASYLSLALIFTSSTHHFIIAIPSVTFIIALRCPLAIEQFGQGSTYFESHPYANLSI